MSKQGSFFDFKIKILLYVWIINCLIIIFAKYSVIPDRYCYVNGKYTHCTGRESEKERRDVDGISEHSTSDHGCKYGDNDSRNSCSGQN